MDTNFKTLFENLGMICKPVLTDSMPKFDEQIIKFRQNDDNIFAFLQRMTFENQYPFDRIQTVKCLIEVIENDKNIAEIGIFDLKCYDENHDRIMTFDENAIKKAIINSLTITY